MKNFKERTIGSYILPNKITTDYVLKQITSGKKDDPERTWQFCFRDCSKKTFENVDENLLLKSKFNLDTKFPSSITQKINLDTIYKLARRKNFGLEKLNIDSSKIHIAVIDFDFIPYEKEFAKNVIVHPISKVKIDNMHPNAIISTIQSIIPNATIHHYNAIGDIRQSIKALESIYNYNLEVNNEEDKILVISVSSNFFDDEDKNSKEYKKLMDLIMQLEDQDCTIITSLNMPNFFDSAPIYNDDFTDITGYEPGFFFVRNYLTDDYIKDYFVLVPGSGRLYAYPSEKDEYFYCGCASVSWVIPHIASFYAIAKTLKPSLSLDWFEKIAFETCDINQEGYKLININSICNYLKTN